MEDWDSVYFNYMPRIFSYMVYRVGDRALAEDLTATTFVKAWKARDSYNPQRGEVVTWLLGIARNTANDYLRQPRRAVHVSLESAWMDADIQRDYRPLEDQHQRDADIARLSQLLNELAPRERELVALRYGAGMTNRAVAALTGVSEANVAQILSRVVRRLRAVWEVTPNE